MKLFWGVMAWLAMGTVAWGVGPETAPGVLTVSADGHGQFATVQAAVDAVPAYAAGNNGGWVIHILPGTYREVITIPREKPHIHFKGDNATTTILTYNKAASDKENGKAIGTFRTPSVSVLADDFTAEHITFANSFGRGSQALAITIAGDRDAFDDCRFIGYQDTIFADSRGRNYFHNCYIAGATDFIFGKSTAVFDHCDIHSVGGGYLTAASTDQAAPFGYVFLDCKLTADPSVRPNSVYLGRPWRPYAAVAFIRCDMGPQIRAVGWMDWNKPERQKTARYAEYGSTGPGGKMDQRVAWAKKLTPAEAAGYTVEKILGGKDHWVPFGSKEAAKP